MLLRSKMRRLPSVHQATLKAILEHLARVVSLSEKNKMDAKNVAIVFGSVIFGEDEMPKGSDILSVQSWKVSHLFTPNGTSNDVLDLHRIRFWKI
jgi:Rho GTPase-activating protein 12/27